MIIKTIKYCINLIFFIILIKNFEIITCTPIVKGIIIEEKYYENYSYMVSLQQLKRSAENVSDEYIHLCGGVLINEEWILTAAHCVYNRKINDTFIQIGINILQSDTQLRYFVEQIILNKFNKYTMRNDIALVRISPKYNNFTQQLSLLKEDDLIDLEEKIVSCKILGFGAKVYGGLYQNNLNVANVNIIKNQECIAILGRIMGPKTGDNTICAVGLNGEDVCQGDSGGPLICSADGKEYLYGIVSHGLSCGGYRIPSVYTMVGKYFKWINSVLLRTEKMALNK